jgi:two-component system, OmpR family, sensor kinase
MLASFAAIFVVVYRDTGSQVAGQIDRDIAGDVGQLRMAMGVATGLSPRQISSAALRYVRAQPFSANSTLLFVVVPGAPTASNHPEVFGAPVLDLGETPGEQAQENAETHELLLTRVGYSTRSVPDVGRMRIFERPLRLGSALVTLGAGEPLAAVGVAQRSVAKAFLLAGATVLVLALVASYLAAARVSAPLRRMATVAARVDAGDLNPRMEVTGGARDEVRVLGEAFNRMLDRLAEAFASQREFVADASHELRTPLTIIRGQLEVLAAQAGPPSEEVRRVERLVQAEITRLSRLVDDLLTLTQAERIDFLRAEPVDLRPFVDELWDGLSLTARRRFELGGVPEGTLRSDPDRLAQAVRNLARNAIEHTHDETGLVRLEVDQVGPDRLRFAVLDDGPGVPTDERERIFERFHRVDGARTRVSGGTGLGLAIVRAIAEAHGGTVRASDRNGQPGARVELVLPGFRAR